MPAEEIERATTAIDWSRTLGKEGLRDRTPIERKLEGTTYTNQLELGLKDGSVVLPGGLLKTQDIEDVIRALINDARFQRDFDNLPIPFRAVATDMVSGQMVVLDSGDLSVAMRASMSIPGAFSPVVLGEQVLSDGGMVRNLPVDIARELCADVVIAVWLSTPEPIAADLDSALALVSRSMDVMIKANERAQIATLAPDDVGIEVPMGDIGTGDFQRVAEAVVLGRAAAEAHVTELSRFSIPENEYLAWRESVTSAEAQPVHLAEVRIEGLQQVSPAYVEAQLQNLKPGADVDSQQIKEDTDRLYALGDFERIEHQLTGPPEARVMEISPVEKSWGPNFLRIRPGTIRRGIRRDPRRVARRPHPRLDWGRWAVAGTIRCRSAARRGCPPSSTNRWMWRTTSSCGRRYAMRATCRVSTRILSRWRRYFVKELLRRTGPGRQHRHQGPAQRRAAQRLGECGAGYRFSGFAGAGQGG